MVLAGIERVFGDRLTPKMRLRACSPRSARRGDDALREWTQRIDGVALDALEVPRPLGSLLTGAAPELQAALQRSTERIRDFHARQPVPNWTTTEMGGMLGQRLVRWSA